MTKEGCWYPSNVTRHVLLQATSTARLFFLENLHLFLNRSQNPNASFVLAPQAEGMSRKTSHAMTRAELRGRSDTGDSVTVSPGDKIKFREKRTPMHTCLEEERKRESMTQQRCDRKDLRGTCTQHGALHRENRLQHLAHEVNSGPGSSRAHLSTGVMVAHVQLCTAGNVLSADTRVSSSSPNPGRRLLFSSFYTRMLALSLPVS